MNSLLRWGKFNLVGAMGMAVQLGALAVFNRCAPAHYLMASTAALELTLLHNFAWHVNYTWRDRRAGSPLRSQLLRFHLTNGLVSIIGNLVLMRLLVAEARMPVVAANGVAILCCSLANFWMGDCWAFPSAAGA